jgi:hypothetical protein
MRENATINKKLMETKIKLVFVCLVQMNSSRVFG